LDERVVWTVSALLTALEVKGQERNQAQAEMKFGRDEVARKRGGAERALDFILYSRSLHSPSGRF